MAPLIRAVAAATTLLATTSAIPISAPSAALALRDASARTGTAYTATFDEESASALFPNPGVPSANVSYDGLLWSGVSVALPKPAGTASTTFLIPNSAPAYGQVAPSFYDNPINFTRTFGQPYATITGKKFPRKGTADKIRLNGFWFGCARPSNPDPPLSYFDFPVNCTLVFEGFGGNGNTNYVSAATYVPVTGDCQQLGSSDPGLLGNGCARLAYFDAASEFSGYGPFESINFTLPTYDNPNVTDTYLYLDDVEYDTVSVPL